MNSNHFKRNGQLLSVKPIMKPKKGTISAVNVNDYYDFATKKSNFFKNTGITGHLQKYRILQDKEKNTGH